MEKKILEVVIDENGGIYRALDNEQIGNIMETTIFSDITIPSKLLKYRADLNTIIGTHISNCIVGSYSILPVNKIPLDVPFGSVDFAANNFTKSVIKLHKYIDVLPSIVFIHDDITTLHPDLSFRHRLEFMKLTIDAIYKTMEDHNLDTGNVIIVMNPPQQSQITEDVLDNAGFSKPFSHINPMSLDGAYSANYLDLFVCEANPVLIEKLIAVITVDEVV